MRYKNPWHKAGAQQYGPLFYETDTKPIKAANGHIIYERIKGVCWDVVKDGVCVSQRAGLHGAHEAARVAR